MSRIELKKLNYLQLANQKSLNSAEIKFNKNTSSANNDSVSFQANNQDIDKNKPTFWRKAGGFLAGSAVFDIVYRPLMAILGNLGANYMGNLIEGLPFEDVDKVAKTMVKKSGIDKKGFQYSYVNASNVEKASEVMFAEHEKNPIFTIFANKGKSRLKEIADFKAKELKEGRNAFYLFNLNRAMAGEKNPSLMLHEIGHAINANYGKLINSLIKTNRRLPAVAMTAILYTGLLHTKNNDDKNKGFFGKTVDFIKNNAGKFTLLSFAPIIFEEGLATKHALKYAREVLGKTANLGSLKKKLGAGFASYVAIAGVSALAVNAGIAVRDKIVEHKPEKS